MSEHDARFQVRFAWWPIRQVWNPVGERSAFAFTGAFYWLRRVYAINNQYHGWIAFQDQQTPDNLKRCTHCHGTGKV